jgi:hypothetical protein
LELSRIGHCKGDYSHPGPDRLSPASKKLGQAFAEESFIGLPVQFDRLFAQLLRSIVKRLHAFFRHI